MREYCKLITMAVLIIGSFVTHHSFCSPICKFPNAVVGKEYEYDLNEIIPGGKNFSITGPTWLLIDNNNSGRVFGKPTKEDYGTNSINVSADVPQTGSVLVPTCITVEGNGVDNAVRVRILGAPLGVYDHFAESVVNAVLGKWTAEGKIYGTTFYGLGFEGGWDKCVRVSPKNGAFDLAAQLSRIRTRGGASLGVQILASCPPENI